MSIENNERAGSDMKLCKNCGKIMKGRTDKKFCHEFCRNSYHNRHKERTSQCERIINKSLHRNRSILRALFDPSKVVTRVDKRELLRQGFHFRYMTHVLTSDKGTQYTFCYEFGYADMGKEGVWLVGDPFTNH